MTVRKWHYQILSFDYANQSRWLSHSHSWPDKCVFLGVSAYYLIIRSTVFSDYTSLARKIISFLVMSDFLGVLNLSWRNFFIGKAVFQLIECWSDLNLNLCSNYYHIQGVTEIQVQNWTMPIKTKNKTFYKNDKKHLTA